MSESGVRALRALISLTRDRNNPNRPNKNSRRAAGDERSWLGGELNRPSHAARRRPRAGFSVLIGLIRASGLVFLLQNLTELPARRCTAAACDRITLRNRR